MLVGDAEMMRHTGIFTVEEIFARIIGSMVEGDLNAGKIGFWLANLTDNEQPCKVNHRSLFISGLAFGALIVTIAWAIIK